MTSNRTSRRRRASGADRRPARASAAAENSSPSPSWTLIGLCGIPLAVPLVVLGSATGPFDDPKAWLFRVLRNHLLDTLKSATVKNEVTIEGVQDPADHYNDPEKHYQRAEMARELNRMLAPRELECVRLRAEGLSYDEVARVLGLHQGTVGATLARAHKKIRRAFGGKEPKQQAVLGCATVPAEGSYSSSS